MDLTGNNGFADIFSSETGCDRDDLEEFLITLSAINEVSYSISDQRLQFFILVCDRECRLLTMTLKPTAIWCNASDITDALIESGKPPFSKLVFLLNDITDGTFIDPHKLLDHAYDFVVAAHQLTRQ